MAQTQPPGGLHEEAQTGETANGGSNVHSEHRSDSRAISETWRAGVQGGLCYRTQSPSA